MLNKFLFSCIIVHLSFTTLYTLPKYPVDISYMVTDFKYNHQDGLKICEVQHGSLSALTGDLYVYGENGTIPSKIGSFFSHFPLIKKWASHATYGPLKKYLSDGTWSFSTSFFTNSVFLELAKQLPTDIYDIYTYHGMVYADSYILKNIDQYRSMYPGIIFINAPILPYWIDKYKMSQLFDSYEDLKQYKADWRVYDKKYDARLSEKIQQDMPCSMYVIKPRKEFLSKGVIVVAQEDLDATLHMILERLDSLKNHPDEKYAYWYHNRDENFIIEKYYESDYLVFSQPLDKTNAEIKDYHYDTTMRIAMILEYNNQKMKYHSLGGFCKLPCKALEEEGTLNQKRISYGAAPFYAAIDKELLEEINIHMKQAMLLLYEAMLNQ